MKERSLEYSGSVWKRWDVESESESLETEMLPKKRLFELCAVPFIEGETIGENRELKPEVEFLPHRSRLLLRNIPTMVLFFCLALLIEAEVNSQVRGVTDLLSGISPAPALYLLFIWIGLMVVFIRSGIMDRKTFFKSLYIYGLAGILFLGSIYSTYRTLEVRGGPTTDPHVAYASTTLFFTLILGLLSYDLVLKGENMFSHLGRTAIFDEAEYDEFKEKLKADLTDGIGPVRYAHIFAALLLSQFLLIWSMRGPLGIGLFSSLAFNTIIDFLLLVGVFQFLIGIIGLRTIIRGEFERKGDRLRPKYLPYHPDGHAGYRDFGKCAMQINVIIILVGIYYVYRGYIAGLRAFPLTAEPSIYPYYPGLFGLQQVAGNSTVELVFWGINYIGPIVLYIVVVIFWFYYTFWDIHKQMVKAKKDLVLKKQMEYRLRADASHASPGYPMDGVYDRDSVGTLGKFADKDSWEDLSDAPEWPINTKKLAWIVSGNAVPVLFSSLTVLPELVQVWG